MPAKPRRIARAVRGSRADELLLSVWTCVAARKWQLEARFDSCRGADKGINAGIVDLGLLKVIRLYDRTLTHDKLHRLLRENHDRNGWLIFYTHDVADSPSAIGCSPQMLRATIEAVQAAGMPCLSSPEALSAIGRSRDRFSSEREASALGASP